MKRAVSISFAILVFLIQIAYAMAIFVDTGNSAFDLIYTIEAGQRYVSTDELAKISDRRFYSATKRKESLSIAGDSYVFSPNNRFVVVAEATYDLSIPTIVTGDAMLVPLDPFIEVLAARFGKGVVADGDSVVFVGETIITPVKVQETLVNEDTAAIVIESIETDESTESTDEQPEPRKTRWLIVIDPGHGGKDPGASAADATREKNIVLDISKRLKAILDTDTLFDAELSRTDDTFIPLRERTEFANNLNADLFISIHCNAARKKSARGTQVFFLAPASSDHARATAALENASIFLEEPDTSGNIDDLDFIMTDLIQNEYLREASRLSVLVEEAITGKTGLPARGPQGAAFYVLKGSFMPGILVETAFISNPDEAELLKRDSFRDLLAEGIAKGLRQFILELPDY